MSLYVKFGKQETIEKFLEKFYGIIGSDRRDAVETYFDKECYDIHCQQKRYRSFDDIFELVNTYYPKTDPKTVFHTLLTLDVRDSNKRPVYMHMSNCSTISRIRMLYFYNEDTCYVGRACSKYQSKWSWIDLLEMLNLESLQAIQAYVKRHRK